MTLTYNAREVADLLGVSEWSIYQSVRDGACPVDPIRVRRRLVWPRAAVDRLLCIASENDEAGPTQDPATSTRIDPSVTTTSGVESHASAQQ